MVVVSRSPADAEDLGTPAASSVRVQLTSTCSELFKQLTATTLQHNLSFMQCRNALRQHVAPHVSSRKLNGSHNALWVTDDMLEEAFTRYVRVSHATRRYGSNVPGPLEARRRQGRRRMGFASAESCGSIGNAEFGALFGAGRYTPGIYTYEPPSRSIQPRQEPPATRGFWPWNRYLGSRAEDEISQRQLAVSPAVGEEDASDNVEASMRHTKQTCESTLNSQQMLDPMLDELRALEVLTAEGISSILSYLDTPSNHERIHENLAALLHLIRSRRGLSVPAYEAIREFIISKHKSRTLSTDMLLANLLSLLHISKKSHDLALRQMFFPTLTKLLCHVKAEIWNRPDEIALLQVYERLFRSITPVELGSKYETCQIAMQTLLEMVEQRDLLDIKGNLVAQNVARILKVLWTGPWSKQETGDIGPLLTQVFATSQEPQLAHKVMQLVLTHTKRSPWWRFRDKISFLLESLRRSGSLSRNRTDAQRLSALRLYHELGPYFQPYQLATHLSSLEPVDFALALLFGWSNSAFKHETTLNKNMALELTKAQIACFQELNTTSIAAIQHPVITLLVHAEQQGHDYSELLQGAFAVMTECYSVQDQCRFYDTLRENRLKIPVAAQTQLVKKFIRLRMSIQAVELYIESGEVSLAVVPSLIAELMRQHIDPADVLDIIKRKHAGGSKKEPKQALSSNVIDLVVKLAVAASRSTNWTARSSFNKVWQCYRFLNDHNIKMDRTISKAISYAGIVRALDEDKSVPNDRLSIIVQVVQWYEGDTVALRLEGLVREARDKRRISSHIAHRFANKACVSDSETGQAVA